MTLRICHLGKYYPPAYGGIETHVRSLAHAQAELGAEVQVLCIDHGTNGTGRLLKGAPASRCSDWDGDVHVTRIRRRCSFARFDFCPGICQILRDVLEQQVDVVHLHVPNPTMLLPLAVHRLRVPLVVTYHSDIVRQIFLVQALRPFERRVFRRAARLLATSPAYIRGSRVLHTYRHKVAVLPFGIALGPFLSPNHIAREYTRRLVAQYGQPLWLCVGRLVYYKGLDVALEALRAVPGRLLVVGEGPLESQLRRKAAVLGVSDRVVWLGRLSEDDLVGAYRAATALWFPSIARSEAFGLVQVEAMASGCPVINTNIPHTGVPWVSRHEESDITVSVNDASAFAQAALQLLGQPGLRKRLANGGVERAVARFGHLKMGQRSLELYDGVVNTRQSGSLELVASRS